MAQIGIAYGRDLVAGGVAKYMPGASALWHSLRYYFDVNNAYVVRKLRVRVRCLGALPGVLPGALPCALPGALRLFRCWCLLTPPPPSPTPTCSGFCFPSCCASGRA